MMNIYAQVETANANMTSGNIKYWVFLGLIIHIYQVLTYIAWHYGCNKSYLWHKMMETEDKKGQDCPHLKEIQFAAIEY